MSATGERGFTLLEMLVVIGIAGLIAGVGFPVLQRQIAAQEWRTSVAAVTAALRGARAEALRSGAVVTVSLTPDGRALRAGAVSIPLPASVAVVLPTPLRFAGDGSANAVGVLVNSGSRQARISVRPGTGTPRRAA